MQAGEIQEFFLQIIGTNLLALPGALSFVQYPDAQSKNTHGSL